MLAICERPKAKKMGKLALQEAMSVPKEVAACF